LWSELILMSTPEFILVSRNELAAIITEVIRSEIPKLLQSDNTGNSTEEIYLDRRQTAEFLHCSLGTLHNWQKSGRLKPIIIGKKRLYPKSLILKSAVNK
jgi:hypothetical protein